MGPLLVDKFVQKQAPSTVPISTQMFFARLSEC